MYYFPVQALSLLAQHVKWAANEWCEEFCHAVTVIIATVYGTLATTHTLSIWWQQQCYVLLVSFSWFQTFKLNNIGSKTAHQWRF